LSSNNENDNGDLAELLSAVDRGSEKALGELVVVLYPELKKLAHFQLARERPGHTLNTTAIVHEAFVRLASGTTQWTDRNHFLRAAATVMRHLLVDYARRRSAEKRGAGLPPLTLSENQFASDDDSVAVLTLDRAIKDIAEIDPRLAQIIECRYFAGLSVTDTARALSMPVRTVERACQRAKGYLINAMESQAT
jgi:RNA polymerase sigma factor (TIGR02999 family)